ncbi:MAG: hypothetical protein JNJ88_12260 [Planctomycetes bacterium]|nr:hypothetical protein [Planctomycetota bacterium]
MIVAGLLLVAGCRAAASTRSGNPREPEVLQIGASEKTTKTEALPTRHWTEFGATTLARADGAFVGRVRRITTLSGSPALATIDVDHWVLLSDEILATGQRNAVVVSSPAGTLQESPEPAIFFLERAASDAAVRPLLAAWKGSPELISGIEKLVLELDRASRLEDPEQRKRGQAGVLLAHLTSPFDSLRRLAMRECRASLDRHAPLFRTEDADQLKKLASQQDDPAWAAALRDLAQSMALAARGS